MVRLPLTPTELERGQRLGALLRRARGTRPMLDVALEAGLSPETLRKIESGRVATPAFPTVAAIAGVLGLSLDEVWARVSRPEAEAETESETETGGGPGSGTGPAGPGGPSGPARRTRARLAS